MKKIFFSETTTAEASMFGSKHCYVELDINHAKNAPGAEMTPPWGVNSSLRLTIGKKIKKKTSSPKPYGPELSHVVRTNV